MGTTDGSWRAPASLCSSSTDTIEDGVVETKLVRHWRARVADLGFLCPVAVGFF